MLELGCQFRVGAEELADLFVAVGLEAAYGGGEGAGQQPDAGRCVAGGGGVVVEFGQAPQDHPGGPGPAAFPGAQAHPGAVGGSAGGRLQAFEFGGLGGPVVGVAEFSALHVHQVQAQGGGGAAGSGAELPPPLGGLVPVGEVEQAGEDEGAFGFDASGGGEPGDVLGGVGVADDQGGDGAQVLGGLTVPAATAAPQALSCTTGVGSTGGWAECTGSGTWRVVSICNNERDKYTTWATQSGGTTRRYAVDCSWDIDRVQVEMK